MNKKTGVFLAVILLFSIFSVGCKKTIGDKAVDVPAEQKNFVAKFKFISKAENFAGKIFSSKDKTRMETPESTVITRTDKNVVWVLLPGEKMYIEYPLQAKNTAAGFHKMPNEVERKLIASETINGKKVNKYQVTYSVNGNNETIYQWVSDDTGTPIKTASVDSNWSYEYDDVQPTTPPTQIFEIPDDYKKFKMPSQDTESITHY